ncbi:MAG: UbiX family flavin prenyltransferase [Candidatus Schekmanbacteria bacterium]|nr:UbiX family flavin prenyltransferase [Candidatus Schekmanbacteria bacterium]
MTTASAIARGAAAGIVVGISGASGTLIGVRLLEALRTLGVTAYLVMTSTARRVAEHELARPAAAIAGLATRDFAPDDLTAPIASGSFPTRGMIVAPCSMKTLAGIASGYSDNLLLRAADVCLKERRPLVLITREAPLSLIHIENMRRVARAGGIVLPAVLTTYSGATDLDSMIGHIVGRALDLAGVDNDLYHRWG